MGSVCSDHHGKGVAALPGGCSGRSGVAIHPWITTYGFPNRWSTWDCGGCLIFGTTSFTAFNPVIVSPCGCSCSSFPTDPVCGMSVREGDLSHPYQGKIFFFCGDGCLASFRAEPGRYKDKDSPRGKYNLAFYDTRSGKSVLKVPSSSRERRIPMHRADITKPAFPGSRRYWIMALAMVSVSSPAVVPVSVHRGTVISART